MIENLIDKIKNIDDSDVKGLFMLGVNALDNPSQKPIVTGSLQKIKNHIKKRDYPKRNQLLDLSIEFCIYIFEEDPENNFYLQKRCEFYALKKGCEDKIISKINAFFERVKLKNLDQNTIDFLTITLASAYASKGDNGRAIAELEAINSSSTKVLDNLARFYLYDGKPQKAIDLLENESNLNEPMAFWLSKSYHAIGKTQNALNVLSPFKNSDRVKKFTNQLSVNVKKSSGNKVSKNKIIVFLSFSFNEKDKDLVSGFIDLLTIHNFQVVTGEKNPIGSLSKSIVGKIRSATIFVVVMTKRDRKENKKFTTSSWLLEEKGVAIALDKPCLMLVEDEIDEKEIGGIQGDDQRLSFSRNNFASKVADAIKMIQEHVAPKKI